MINSSTYIHVRPVTVSSILSPVLVIAVTTMEYWTPELKLLNTISAFVIFTD